MELHIFLCAYQLTNEFINLLFDLDIEIETDIEDEININSDSELLSLVWNNLLSNAFKFT